MRKATTQQPAIQWIPIEDIKRENRAAGQHWFDPTTLRFFSSRVAEHAYQGGGGTFFVSSERDDWNNPRRYSVREAVDGGKNIANASGFQEYESIVVAHRAAIKRADGTPDQHAAFLEAIAQEKAAFRHAAELSRTEWRRREQERATAFDHGRAQ
jgi:hypothetical protein